MMDANQKWGVDEAVEWMTELARFKPLWIEEPTSPDDILGHATIAKVGHRKQISGSAICRFSLRSQGRHGNPVLSQ